MKTSIPIRLALLLSAITLPCQALRAETFNLNLGAVIKDGIHKALQGDHPMQEIPLPAIPPPANTTVPTPRSSAPSSCKPMADSSWKSCRKATPSRGMPDREQAS
ncbi:Uncharacterised protein [Chromobacterium violaceum]|uniref:Uncharacterized protein n=1 Tax=Chromobacterium violaceum TaxID=536 RepID=A0A447T9N7_CHRVL|nr:Uncharacterised protein [Chromobacterium violaceum]